jgi:hypothetical protein
MYPWKEIIIIICIIFIIWKIYTPIKNFYAEYHKKKTIQKFKDICDIVELNMMVEDSMKVYPNKIDHRYTVELHRRIPGTNKMDPVPIEKTIDEINKKFTIDKNLSDEIIKISQMGLVEEFFYGKHPFLPQEKIYVGFSTRQNMGYLLEKNKNVYKKKLYINTIEFNLRTIFPIDIAERLHGNIPFQILQPKHIYKYEDGKVKPMSCYIGIKKIYNVGNIMEVFINILKVFHTDEKIIEESNEFMKQYKDNECYWIGLTNDYGKYYATIYYSREFEN